MTSNQAPSDHPTTAGEDSKPLLQEAPAIFCAACGKRDACPKCPTKVDSQRLYKQLRNCTHCGRECFSPIPCATYDKTCHQLRQTYKRKQRRWREFKTRIWLPPAIGTLLFLVVLLLMHGCLDNYRTIARDYCTNTSVSTHTDCPTFPRVEHGYGVNVALIVVLSLMVYLVQIAATILPCNSDELREY